MEIVKKNIASIVCGVVAIAAIVAWFWPIGGMYSTLKADVDKSKQQYDQIEQLRKAPRKLPTLVLEGSPEQAELKSFPNEKVIAAGKAKTAALTAQSKKMLDTVTQLNIHRPLVEGSLPSPSQLAAQVFPTAYMEKLGLSPKGYETGIPKLLNATSPPTNDELTEIAQDLWETNYKNRILLVAGIDNYQDVANQFTYDVVANLKEQEQRKRATNHMIYLDEVSLASSNDIQPGKVPNENQIWFAQVGLWIEEDVASAIVAANKGAKNILDAPVKHLYSLKLPFGGDMYIRGVGQSSGAAEATALPTDANGAPQLFIASPTGRACNDLYDVVHFDLVLRVDYAKIPQILNELERDRLFTVLTTSVSSVDAADEKNKYGYIYGDQPVAELSLTCEALFLRSWTVDKDNNFKSALMPKAIRQHVGAEPGPGLGMGGGMAVPGQVPMDNLGAENMMGPGEP
jgi:hypothetical protein